MAVALTKANIKAIPYGKEVGFGRGIMGRKLKDGESARMFLQKKTKVEVLVQVLKFVFR